MDDINSVINKISKVYDKSTFLDKYGGDFFVTLFLFIIFFIVLTYFTILNNIEPIKSDWIRNRCKPHILPFAGVINAPDGTSILDYTISNFNGCLNNILSNVSKTSIDPFYYLINVGSLISQNIINSIENFRNVFNNIRNNIVNINKDIQEKSLNFTIPIVQTSITFKDTIEKIKGIFASIIYSLYGTYMSLEGVVRIMYDSSVAIIVAIVAFIVVLMIIPFVGWTMAAPIIAILGIAIVPLAQTSIIMKKILKMNNIKNIPSVPSRKRCFHPYTKIQLKNNDFSYIKDIKIGDILYDGSIVEGIMKTSPEDHEFYSLRDIIITSTHKVFDYNTSKWIYVKDHIDSIKYNKYNKKEMYCISTNTKYIKINNLYFTDWDELDEEMINELKKIAIDNFINKNEEKNEIEQNNEIDNIERNNYIHKYFDGGFIYNTPIELNNGNFVNISKIKLNDILKNGEKVLGIIKIDIKNIYQLKEYYLNNDNNKLFIGTNIVFLSNIIKNKCYINSNDKNINNKNIKFKYLYHLVTDRETFYINNIKVGDYNSCLDINLSKIKENILLNLL